MMRRRVVGATGAAAVLALAVGTLTAGAARGAPNAGSPDLKPVTITKHVTRTVTASGATTTVDNRKVSLHVAQTVGLRDRQEIDVSWRGAHPTGGVIGNLNSSAGLQEEYPMVLLECRGVDSAKAPKAKQLSPQTCWTNATTERFQSDYNYASNNESYPPWRLDRYASAKQRAPLVGAPATRPADCFGAAPEEYWVPFVAVDGTKYPGGPNGCAGTAPEAVGDNNQSLPSNETYGVTQNNGQGSTKFDVWTDETNSSLGCSFSVKCSLVAVPIMGISCDPGAEGLPADDKPPADEIDQDTKDCEATGHFAPGEVGDGNGHEDAAVSGALWWASSNWRNRLSVPLSFAQTPNVCDVVGAGTAVQVYGSELMTQLTQQWAPKFCLSKSLFNFKHVQIGEPEARTQLASASVDAIFTTQPQTDGYSFPTVSAPTAVSGFAITFDIDNSNGDPVASLKLDPRLLAKLMTESYPALTDIKTGDKALVNNPLNITDDPEFQALNPGITSTSQVASTILDLSSQSDVVYALTSYINADPEARAWLDGKPDPWGMVVNKAYKGIQLPVNSWPLLDTYEPTDIYQPGLNDCLYNTPVPYLPLVAAPVQRLSQIALAMQFAIANSQTVCYQPLQGQSSGERLTAIGRQQLGYRFMLGVTSIPDAERYRLSMASLETQATAAAKPDLSSLTGRTFVKPSLASMQAAARLAQPDPTTGTWPIDAKRLRHSSAGANAYPGTMIVYTTVPTKGLSATLASDYSKLLDYAATAGQTRGFLPGQLPPGYLPMTTADGFGKLINYTGRAALAVLHQKGVEPSLLVSKSGRGGGGGGNPKNHNDGGPPGSIQVPDPGTAPDTIPPATSTSSSNPTTSDSSPAVASPTPQSLGTTTATSSTLAGLALPLLLGLALVAGLAAPAIARFVGGRRGT